MVRRHRFRARRGGLLRVRGLAPQVLTNAASPPVPLSAMRRGGTKATRRRRAFRADQGARGYRCDLHVGPPRRPRTSRRLARRGMALRPGRRPGGPIPDGVDQHPARGTGPTDDRRIRRAGFRADPWRGNARRVPARGRPGESAARLRARIAEARRLLSLLSTLQIRSPEESRVNSRPSGSPLGRLGPVSEVTSLCRLSGNAEPRL